MAGSQYFSVCCGVGSAGVAQNDENISDDTEVRLPTQFASLETKALSK